jgi:hypothetical protein
MVCGVCIPDVGELQQLLVRIAFDMCTHLSSVIVRLLSLINHPPFGTPHWHQEDACGQDALWSWLDQLKDPTGVSQRSSYDWPVDTQLLLIGLINCMWQRHVCVGDYSDQPHIQQFLQTAVDEARIIRRCRCTSHDDPLVGLYATTYHAVSVHRLLRRMHLGISLHCLCKELCTNVGNTGSLFLDHFNRQDCWTDQNYNPDMRSWYRLFVWGPWVEDDLRDPAPSPFNRPSVSGESRLGMGFFMGGSSVDFISLVNHVIEHGFFMGSMTIVQALVDKHTQWGFGEGIMSNPLTVGYVVVPDTDISWRFAHSMEVTYGEHLPGKPSHAGYIILENHHFRWKDVDSLEDHPWLEAIECHSPVSFDPEHLQVGSRWEERPDGSRLVKWEEHEVHGVNVGFTCRPTIEEESAVAMETIHFEPLAPQVARPPLCCVGREWCVTPASADVVDSTYHHPVHERSAHMCVNCNGLSHWWCGSWLCWWADNPPPPFALIVHGMHSPWVWYCHRCHSEFRHHWSRHEQRPRHRVSGSVATEVLMTMLGRIPRVRVRSSAALFSALMHRASNRHNPQFQRGMQGLARIFSHRLMHRSLLPCCPGCAPDALSGLGLRSSEVDPRMTHILSGQMAHMRDVWGPLCSQLKDLYLTFVSQPLSKHPTLGHNLLQALVSLGEFQDWVRVNPGEGYPSHAAVNERLHIADLLGSVQAVDATLLDHPMLGVEEGQKGVMALFQEGICLLSPPLLHQFVSFLDEHLPSQNPHGAVHHVRSRLITGNEIRLHLDQLSPSLVVDPRELVDPKVYPRVIEMVILQTYQKAGYHRKCRIIGFLTLQGFRWNGFREGIDGYSYGDIVDASTDTTKWHWMSGV